MIFVAGDKLWNKFLKKDESSVIDVLSKMLDASDFASLEVAEKEAVIEMQKAVYLYLLKLEEELDEKFLKDISGSDGSVMRPLVLQEKDRQLYRNYINSKSGINLPLEKIIADTLTLEMQRCLGECADKLVLSLGDLKNKLSFCGEGSVRDFLEILDDKISIIEEQLVRAYRSVLSLEEQIRATNSDNDKEKKARLMEMCLEEKTKQLQRLLVLGKELLVCHYAGTGAKERVLEFDKNKGRK